VAAGLLFKVAGCEERVSGTAVDAEGRVLGEGAEGSRVEEFAELEGGGLMAFVRGWALGEESVEPGEFEAEEPDGGAFVADEALDGLEVSDEFAAAVEFGGVADGADVELDEGVLAVRADESSRVDGVEVGLAEFCTDELRERRK
jgi:hypothetical protein